MYAEVIGDPVARSRSPLIHKYWLDQLKLTGDYRRTRVPKGAVATYLAERLKDPDWRGCNVTIPNKEDAAQLARELDVGASAIGAVNCLVPRASGLFGSNTDVEGIAAALDDTALERGAAVIIGSGGAARAAAAYLAGRNIGEVRILVRDPAKARQILTIIPKTSVEIGNISAAGTLIAGAALIINASPMGMT